MTKDEKRTERLWRLYEKLYDEPAPAEDVVIHWNYDGLCIYYYDDRPITTKAVLAFAFAEMRSPEALSTVVHELHHLHDFLHTGKSSHGAAFEKENRRLLKIALSSRRS